jgi:DNA replication protein DnaC
MTKPQFHPRTLALLEKAGLAPAEIGALAHRPLMEVPPQPRGFGLVGPPGTGKTWTVAHYVARYVEEIVRRQPDPNRAELLWVDGDIARDARLAWVNWHDQVEDLHRRRFDDVWVARFTAWWEDIPMLVLDDLGRERFEGAKDPARAVLEQVLDTRYRQRRPVIWTSNLESKEALEGFYHHALVSRILGTWPPMATEGEDMRLLPMASGGEA